MFMKSSGHPGEARGWGRQYWLLQQWQLQGNLMELTALIMTVPFLPPLCLLQEQRDENSTGMPVSQVRLV